MKPIVLIHGYSSESPTSDPVSIGNIYGDLPDRLRTAYNVVEIDLSRYVSLNDSVSIADIARAFHRALVEQHPALLKDGFHVVIHSTGALVIRTWIRLFSPKPSPVGNLVYLAGANFGSGWASIGQGQVARWGRFVFERGAQRGVKVLQSLELGASPTLDLHLFFTQDGSRMLENYKVQEYIIIGTQADPGWFEFPVRYAHEDGSDGVVRVAAGNLNFNYLTIEPNDDAALLAWPAIHTAVQAASVKGNFPSYYQVRTRSIAGVGTRQAVPIGIPFRCAHSGKDMGVVSGTAPREQVERMLRLALETPENNNAAWQRAAAAFDRETTQTYESARTLRNPGLFNFLTEPRNQYDPHAQIIFRVRDQDGNPIPIANTDIFFVSEQTTRGTIPVQKLIEDTVVSSSKNVIMFYLRLLRFDKRVKAWVDQLAQVGDFALEITAIEPAAPVVDPLVVYLPVRIPLTSKQLEKMIQPHRTTIVDVTLLRLSSPDIYQLVKS